MEVSPNFERFKKTIMLRGEPDRVPLAELTVEQQVREAFLGRKIQSVEDDVEFWVSAGYDFVPVSIGLRSLLGPDLDKTGNTFQAAKTPLVAQYSAYDNGLSRRAWAVEGQGIISNRADFEAFNWPTPADFDLSILDEYAKLLPEKMKVVAAIGYIYTTVWETMGMETFFLTLTDDPGLISDLFERVGSIQKGVFERVIEHPVVGGFWMPDDMAYTEDLLVSPSVLRKYLFPWYKEMGKVCRERDIPFILHSDGRLLKVVDDILDCGFNAIHPIEPKAMDIRELKRGYGDRLAFIGNLNLGGELAMGTPEEVREVTKNLIRDIGPGGGYCVGSSNSVTEYVPLENYKAMREAVFEFGKYPISV